MVLQTFTAQDKGTDSRLSAALQWLIECIDGKVMRLPQITAEVTEAVVDNPRFTVPTAALVTLELRKCTDKRAKIEGRCPQYIKAVMKLNFIAVSNRSKLVGNTPSNVFNDVKTNSRVYSMETLLSDSDYHNRENAQPANVDKYHQETYKTNKD